MSITANTFIPGDLHEDETAEKKEKLRKKLKKAKRGKHSHKKKIKKLKKKLKNASNKLTYLESIDQERELRHQAELQNARLEAVMQLLLEKSGKLALPEVSTQYER